MNLQEKHLEAIDTVYGVFKTDYSMMLSAQCSEKITKDYMKRFSEWLRDRYVFNEDNWFDGNSSKTFETKYTTDELIEIFLNNENKQP